MNPNDPEIFANGHVDLVGSDDLKRRVKLGLRDLRLIDLHEAAKTCSPDLRHYYEREIARRHSVEHQRELEEWRKNRLISFES